LILTCFLVSAAFIRLWINPQTDYGGYDYCDRHRHHTAGKETVKINKFGQNSSTLLLGAN